MEKNKYADIFIGQIIQEKIHERHLNYAEFARMIGCSRSALYNLFAKKSIDTEMLLQISEVLDYDFISEVYHWKKRNLDSRIGCLDSHIIYNMSEEVIEQIACEIKMLLKDKFSG